MRTVNKVKTIITVVSLGLLAAAIVMGYERYFV